MLLPSRDAVGTPYDDIHWSAVLKSVSGFEMYRKKHGRITPRNIVEFLVLDLEFPRAIRHCLRGADESLHAITGTPMGSCDYPSERALAPLRAELDYTSVDNDHRPGLARVSGRSASADEHRLMTTWCSDFFAGCQPSSDPAQGGGGRQVLMGIRVGLYHKTTYQYDRLVTLSPQIVRLRPAPHTPHSGHQLFAAHRTRGPLHQLAAGPAGQFPGPAGLSRANPPSSRWKWTWWPR